MSASLSVERLSKTFFPPGRMRAVLMKGACAAPVEAVKDASFEVQPGEVFGLLGPNGAGKTTLIKMLTTLLLPTSGTARVAGFDVVASEGDVRASVALVSSEERSFYWRLTARQNLAFHAALLGRDRDLAVSRIPLVLDLMGLADVSDRMVYSLSSGMRQKLCIARSLLGRPRVLFLDEPTRAVDAVVARDVKSFIRGELTSEGRTVLLATHRLEEAEEVCDRIAIMREGEVAFCGTVSQLRRTLDARERCIVRIGRTDDATVARIAQEARLRGLAIEHPTGNGLLEMRFAVRSGDGQLSRVLEGLLAAEAEIVSCDQQERSLEDMFIDMVGEAS